MKKTLIVLYIFYISALASTAIVQAEVRPEVRLYLEGQKFDSGHEPLKAAQKYQEALSINPTFVLAKRKLASLAPSILPDHRKILKIEPGYTVKPSASDSKAIRGPIWVKDIMPGYLMVYRDPVVGEYALYSLSSRYMHNVHYLFVNEDKTWREYPSVSLPSVTRMNDILVYHQPGETLQEGFINILINAFSKK